MNVRGGGQAADERHVQRANGYDSDGEGEGARGKPFASTGDTADVTGIGVSLCCAWEGVKAVYETGCAASPPTPGAQGMSEALGWVCAVLRRA